MFCEVASLAWRSLLSIHGESITVIDTEGRQSTFDAIFTRQTLKIESDTGMTVRTMNPSIGFLEQDAEVTDQHTLLVRGELYIPNEIVPDGLGAVRVELHKLETTGD